MLFLFFRTSAGRISASSRPTGILKALLHVLLFIPNLLVPLVFLSDTEKVLKHDFLTKPGLIRVLSHDSKVKNYLLGGVRGGAGRVPVVEV